MNKVKKIQLLIDEHDFKEEDLKEKTAKELDELFPIETKAKELTEEESTGYYPKDEFFGQSIDMVDRKSKIPKAVKVEVDYRIIKFKHGTIKFVKGQEVSAEELALMSDYQKGFYLDAK